MALRVWLPLNGNLENKGISDVTITNNGATIDNNGKIGKCYSFNGNYIKTDYSNYPNIFSGDFSICFWVYSTTNKARDIYFANYGLSGSGNWFNLERDANNYLRFWWANGSPDYHNGSFTINQNEWTHISVIKSENTLTFYKNSNLINSYTTTLSTAIPLTATTFYLGADYRTGQSIDLYGKINDFRIYDHCLSAKEVKEISQGLVLHYKLDGFSGGAGENLLWNSKKLDIASAISNKNCSNRGSSVRQLRTDGFNEVRCSAAWQGLSAWVNQFNLKSGDKLTYSFYVYTNGSNKSLSFYPMMYDSSGARDTSSKLDISLDGGAYTSTNSKSWGAINNTAPIRHYVTFIWNDTMASILNNGGKIELSIQIHGTFNSGEYGYIFAPKLEYGDKPTAWSPAPEEIGIDITRITDSSGYGNDGIINGNLITNNNTSKYSSSTFFDGNTAAIKIPFNDIIKDKNYTVSCWTYKTTIGTKNYQTILGGPSGFELEARSSSNTSPLYRIHNWGGGTTPYEFNKWNHFCFVHTDVDSKLYVNGELKITGTSANIPTGNYFIGSWSTATSQNYEGQMSDFRLYTTALSAEDIADLYHTPANIDNLGGIHGFEFIEKTPNLLNSDPREWTKESSVTCVWNEETGYFDVNTNRDTSVTSRWGVYTGVPIKPNTAYLFSAEVLDNKSYIGVAGGTSSRSLPSNIISWNGEKRYYYFFTTSSSHTHAWVYLCSKPSETTAGHFKNIYLGEVGEIASIKQNGIFENEDMIEYNENGRITKSGELAGSNFIEK